jgi:regulator of protease activity HflC (stomatin/prohibitin superfamily)
VRVCAQVESVEEQYSSHMRQLEAQLEEALQQQQQAEAAAAAAEAAAAEAAAVAAAAAAAVAAGDGSGHGWRYLPAIDTSSAAERTLQLLDKLLLVRSGVQMLHIPEQP